MGSFHVLSCLQASYIVYMKGVKSLIFGAWYVLNTNMVVSIVNSRWGSAGRWSGNDCYFSHWKRWTSKAARVTSCFWQEESLCTAWFRTSHLVGKVREYKGSRRGSRCICASLHGPEGSYWSYLWSAGQCSSLLCPACTNAPVWGIVSPKTSYWLLYWGVLHLILFEANLFECCLGNMIMHGCEMTVLSLC